MEDDLPDYSHILHLISKSQDPAKLITFAMNAQKKNVSEVRKAALTRLDTLCPSYKEGSFEHDFWEMLMAYLKLLLENNRPTKRLMKAWQIARCEGEISALNQWVDNAEQSWAFEHFIGKAMLNQTAEKLVLKYPKRFEAEICENARKRIKEGKL